MARPSKADKVDFALPHDLTHGLVERASCPKTKPNVVLKDSDKKGLRVRITPHGKHWQFETRIKGKLFTRALGEWPTVSIAQARGESIACAGSQRWASTQGSKNATKPRKRPNKLP